MAEITKKIKQSMFVKSFSTFRPMYINSMLIDFVSIIIFIGILALYYYTFAWITNRIFFVYQSDILFAVCLILISALALILFSLNTAFFKRLSYKIVTGKTEPFKNWFVFTFFWYIPWMIVFILAMIGLKEMFQGVLITVLVILYLALTSIARLEVQNTYKKTVKRAFNVFLQLKKLLIPYALILIICFVIFAIAGQFFRIGMQLYAIVLLLLLLFLVTWAKYYLFLVVKKIK